MSEVRSIPLGPGWAGGGLVREEAGVLAEDKQNELGQEPSGGDS